MTAAAVLRNRSGIKGTASAGPGRVLGQRNTASWPEPGRAANEARQAGFYRAGPVFSPDRDTCLE